MDSRDGEVAELAPRVEVSIRNLRTNIQPEILVTIEYEHRASLVQVGISRLLNATLTALIFNEQ